MVTRDFPFPVENARHSMPPFIMRSLFATQLSTALLAVAAVVRGIVNDGVVELAELLELGNESTDGAVGVVDSAVVDGSLIVECAIPGDNLIRGRNDRVGLIEPEVEKEGLAGVTFLFEPVNGFINDELAGVAFHGTDGFAVAQKVGGIFVTGMSPIDQAEPVVEAMFGRGGVVAIVYRHTEMPFTKVSGAVAFVFQDFGERGFTAKQMHSVTLFIEDGIDSGADVVATGEEGGARGGADRSPGMEVGEAHATGGQLVEDGSLGGTAVAADVAVTQIVDKESDDVGLFVFGKDGANQKQGT